jgi:hypothetical protein
MSAAACADPCKAVLFGSAATDLYIDPYMRFGEAGGHQDLDFLLVPPADSEVPEVTHLHDFFAAVCHTMDDSFPTMLNCISTSVNMTSNGRYCAHFFVGGRHFADVTVLPAAVDDVMEATFPRPRVPLQLLRELLQVKVKSEVQPTLAVASLPELLHRLASISESVPLVDGLPVLKQQYNTVVIQKSRLRLQRLRQLKRLDALHTDPQPWGSQDPRELTEPPCAIQQLPYVMPDFFSSCPSYTNQLTSIATCFDALCTSFTRAVGDTTSTLHCKLNAANASGKRLAAAMTQHRARRRAAQAVATRVKNVRVDVLATAHPAGVLHRVHSGILAIQAALSIKAISGGSPGDAAFSDYSSLYTYMVGKMASLQAYPFSLFPLTGDMPSEPCPAKRHIMSTFFVFLRVMHLSKGGVVDQDVRVYASYDEWSRSGKGPDAVMDWVAAHVLGVKRSDASVSHCIPYVEAGGDGSLKLAVMHTPCDEIREDSDYVTTPENMEMMMRMLDNVVHAITYPILLHVKALKKAISTVQSLSKDMEAVIVRHMSVFPHTPFVKEITGLQEMQRDAISQALRVESKCDEEELYSWVEGADVGKKKRSKKKKSGKKK